MVYILFLLAFVALGVGIWLLSGDTQATDTHANHDQPRRTTPSWSGLRRGQNTARRTWAEAKGFSFAKTDSTLVGQWQRGAASTGAAPRDIATGRSHHHDVHVMDLGRATVVAMATGEASDVVVDIRRDGFEDTKLSSKHGHVPSDDLVEVERVDGFAVWGTDPGPVQRFVDSRVRRALTQLPEAVDAVWFEGEWVLAQLSRESEPEQWEATFEPLALLADTARTLPPRDPKPLTFGFGIDAAKNQGSTAANRADTPHTAAEPEATPKADEPKATPDATSLKAEQPAPELQAPELQAAVVQARPKQQPNTQPKPQPAERPTSQPNQLAGKREDKQVSRKVENGVGKASISKKAPRPGPSAAETKRIAKVKRPEAPMALPTRTTGAVRGPVQQRAVGGDEVDPIADPLADAIGPAHGPAPAPDAMASDLTKVRRQLTPSKIFSTSASSTSASGEKENRSE